MYIHLFFIFISWSIVSLGMQEDIRISHEMDPEQLFGVNSFYAHPRLTEPAVISPDGNYSAVIDEVHKKIIISNRQKPSDIRILKYNGLHRLTHISWSRDASKLAIVISDDDTTSLGKLHITIWNLKTHVIKKMNSMIALTGGNPMPIYNHRNAKLLTAWSHDNRYFSITPDGWLMVFDTVTGDDRAYFLIGDIKDPSAISWSPQDTYISALDRHGRLKIWSTSIIHSSNTTKKDRSNSRVFKAGSELDELSEWIWRIYWDPQSRFIILQSLRNIEYMYVLPDFKHVTVCDGITLDQIDNHFIKNTASGLIATQLPHIKGDIISSEEDESLTSIKLSPLCTNKRLFILFSEKQDELALWQLPSQKLASFSLKDIPQGSFRTIHSLYVNPQENYLSAHISVFKYVSGDKPFIKITERYLIWEIKTGRLHYSKEITKALQ